MMMPVDWDMAASGSELSSGEPACCTVCLGGRNIAGECDLIRLARSGVTVKSKITRWERERRPPDVSNLIVGIFDSCTGSSPLCWSCLCLIRGMDRLEAILDNLFVDFWTLVSRHRQRARSGPLVDKGSFASVPVMTVTMNPSFEENPAASSSQVVESFSQEAVETSCFFPAIAPDPLPSINSLEFAFTSEVPIPSTADPSFAERNTAPSSESIPFTSEQNVTVTDSTQESPMEFRIDPSMNQNPRTGAELPLTTKMDLGVETTKPKRGRPPKSALRTEGVTHQNSGELMGGQTAPKFPCEICVRDFPTAHSLAIHKGHRRCAPPSPSSKPKILKRTRKRACDICGKILGRLGTLKSHKQKKHGVGLKIGPNGEPIRKYPCELCDSSFDLRNKLEDHEQTAHPSAVDAFPCSKCDEKFVTLRKLQKHEKRHTVVVCPVCGIELEGKDPNRKLREHVAIKHENRKLYKCKTCGEEFFYDALAKKHEWQVHGMRKEVFEHPCPICGKFISSKVELLRHKYVRHHIQDDALQVFPCERCHKYFFRMKELKEHMRSHDKIKPHACGEPGCAYADADFSLLQQHMLSVHKRIIRREFLEGRQDGGGSVYSIVDAEDELRAEDGPASG